MKTIQPSMDPSRLDLFVDNVQAAKKGLFWKDTILRRLAALLFAASQRSIDLEAIKACERRVKESTGVFSTFRGNPMLTITTLLALADDPDRLLSDTLLVYDLLKAAKFKASDYLVIAACLAAAHAEPDQYEQVASRARAFYDGMKKDHWFLTGQDDTIYAVMLGVSGFDVRTGLANLEQLYVDLKPEFRYGNSVQALTQVLVLGGDPQAQIARVRSLNDACRANGLRMDRETTLPALGILALLPRDRDTIVQEIQMTFDDLRARPGFGSWSIGKQELLLLAAALVAFDSVDAMEKDIVTTALSTSIANIVIAQQTAVAVMAATSASVAASSAAN